LFSALLGDLRGFHDFDGLFHEHLNCRDHLGLRAW
jgi:hypothetical protein